MKLPFRWMMLLPVRFSYCNLCSGKGPLIFKNLDWYSGPISLPGNSSKKSENRVSVWAESPKESDISSVRSKVFRVSIMPYNVMAKLRFNAV
jgi:hypothetical protein